MCTVSIWKCPTNFKIKRKSDVYYFLEKCLINKGEYEVIVRPDYCLFIRKDEEKFIENGWEVTAKFGDLYDVFNPEVQLTEEEAIRTLWFYRKKINDQFFAS